jgi:hypothetical protein
MAHPRPRLLQPFGAFGADFAPPGPWYPRNYLEDVAEGPADAEFALWWELNGQKMPVYVADCRFFMRYMKEMVEGMLRELRSGRRTFDIDLACLIHNIRKWMDDNSRVTFALERLQHAPAFTSEERRNYSAEMKLYRRADAGRRLIQEYYLQLIHLPVNPDARLVAPLLTALIGELKTWLADACRS